MSKGYSIISNENFEEYQGRLDELVTALAMCAVPYEALLIDAESRKWIAPEVWGAIESAVLSARAALARAKGEG